MKGLILKDIYGIRFQVIIGLLIMLFPNIMFFLAGGGLNIGTEGTVDNIIGIMMYGIMNILNIMLFSSSILNTLKDDAANGWAKYQLTMPVTKEQIVTAKLVSTLINIGTLVLLSMIFNLIAVFLFKMPLELMLTMPICIGVIQLIALLPAFPISMRLSPNVANVLYTCFMCIVLIAAIVVVTLMLDNTLPMFIMRIVFYAVIPVIAVVVGLFSHRWASKLLNGDNYI